MGEEFLFANFLKNHFLFHKFILEDYKLDRSDEDGGAETVESNLRYQRIWTNIKKFGYEGFTKG